jgi:hypothetical protein
MLRILRQPTLWCTVLTFASGALLASEQDPKTVLLEVRHKVLLSIDRLPKYMCTQTVERVTYVPKEQIVNRACDERVSRKQKSDRSRVRKYTADRLRLDVTISAEGEIYSWVGEKQFQDKSLAALVHGGATSTGAFASFLRSIFGGDAASFTFNGQMHQAGSDLMEFGFRVARERSQYQVGDDRVRANVAFDGTFLVDPTARNLVRLSIRAIDPPKELSICDDTTDLEYNNLQLNGLQLLLPSEVRMHVINNDATELENHSVFSGCHEFHGESALSFKGFGDSPPPIGEQSALASVPAGLPLAITLQNAIDVRRAAAGDTVKGLLAGPLRSKETTLLPKGAVVQCRILMIERAYGHPWETLKLALVLESVERNESPQPFFARLDSAIKTQAQTPVGLGNGFKVRQDLGTFGEMLDSKDSRAGVFTFEDVTDDFVIKRGMQVTGTTIAR